MFVLFHLYVLLQVLLLGRTAAAYNEVMDTAVASEPENALMRQRLANTLFAQIFAGSPRERKGWLGWLLRAMAWTTLALAPIYITLAFQFVFLPYHSHLATWIHRLLVLAELLVAFLLWPLVLDARKDFNWKKLLQRIESAAAAPYRLVVDAGARRMDWRRLRLQAIPVAACVSFVAVSLLLATFPGEPHINLLTGRSPFAVQCNRGISRNFDRLMVERVDVVDQRTRGFRERDMNCAIFASADLRRTDPGTDVGGSFPSRSASGGRP